MKIIIFIIVISGFIFNSCSDCALEPADPKLNCAPREATVTRFDPSVIPNTVPDQNGNDSTYYTPTPEFSIHGYNFPTDKQSSGSTPNDSRFTDTDQIPVVSEPFVHNNKIYYAKILSTYPPNNQMNFDFLIQSVDVNNLTAVIRFKGYFYSTGKPLFNSENSDDYCSDIVEPISQSEVSNYKRDALLYGGSNPFNFNQNDMVPMDEKGNVVTDIDVLNTFNNNKNVLFNALAAKSDGLVNVAITISRGETFYYRSQNGREYIATITDIKEGSLPPNKKRVTIMFNPVE